MLLNFLTKLSNDITRARCHVSHHAFELVQPQAKKTEHLAYSVVLLQQRVYKVRRHFLINFGLS